MDSSDSYDDVIVSSLMLVASTLYRRRQLRVRTRNITIWARHWISKREEYGAYNGLVREIRVNEHIADILSGPWSDTWGFGWGIVRMYVTTVTGLHDNRILYQSGLD